MQRKLTITVDEAVYEGLARIVGRGRISRFIEDLVRPHVLGSLLEVGYREMAGELGMNVSQTVDTFLQSEVRRLYREKWRAENQTAIAAYNERVKRDGVFGDGVRSF